MGYLNSYWTFGIPLGGLYWFWKLRQQKNDITETEIMAYQDFEPKPTIDNEKPITE